MAPPRSPSKRTGFLDTPLQFVRGVGPRRAADLARVGLHTVEDFLLRFPLRYEDRAALMPIRALRPGQAATVVGEVLSCGLRSTRRPGFRLFEAIVKDATGHVRAVFPNQAFLRDVFHPGQHIVMFGALEFRSGGLQFTNPEYELIGTTSERERGSHASGAGIVGPPQASVQGGPGDEVLRQASERERGSHASGAGIVGPPQASVQGGPGDEVPRSEIDDDATLHTGRIVPIYEKAGSMTTRVQRTLMHQLLASMPEDLPDPLPPQIRDARRWPDRRAALAAAHFPAAGTSIDDLNACRTVAQRRLVFEEFFLFQAGLVLRKRHRDADKKGRAAVVDDRIRDAVRRVLPFRLTAGQKTALREIVLDMQRPEPMNRLLQGDVGAGKTIVALLAALVAMENRLQVAFMAPTEILADQHYLTIRRLLDASRFRVASLTGSLTPARRKAVYAELASGAIHLVVGTHALAEDALSFHELGLVIIDEQHRFGVMQRALLRAKGVHPDVLVMTATPIPRTLALTTYGDLDSSIIRELPPGRQPIRTLAKPESRRDEVYEMVRRELERGRQAYVIYPLVEDSEKVDLRAAVSMADHLQADVFPQYRVALLHGRLKQDEKDRVMAAFTRGDVHVLVSTTVVEVGVDVPNATMMVVEHAERFGLAQLHQLRGRVGRGEHPSTCALLYQAPLSEVGRARLDALVDTTDGFVIAERDLALRGPGDFFGTRQSGLPTLRVGDLMRDHAVMEDARREAVAWLDRRDSGPLVAYLSATWATRFGLVGVG